MGFLLAFVLMFAVGTITTRFFAGDGVAPTSVSSPVQDISSAAYGFGDAATQPTISSFWRTSVQTTALVATYSGTYALDQIRGPAGLSPGMWLLATGVVGTIALAASWIFGYEQFRHLRQRGSRPWRRLTYRLHALRRQDFIASGRVVLNSWTLPATSAGIVALLTAAMYTGPTLVVLGGISLALVTLGTLTYERRHLSQRDRVGEGALDNSTMFSARHHDPGSPSGVTVETSRIDTTTTRRQLSNDDQRRRHVTRTTLGIVGT